MKNHIISKPLKLGFKNIEARIQKIDDKEHPEAQVDVILYGYKDESEKKQHPFNSSLIM